MSSILNDFVITVATANGSGSQSSNNVLVRSLFRMGIPVGGKNLFPSNIQGLPTWFSIRANPHGHVARKASADIYMAMNPVTADQDLLEVRPEGLFFYNKEIHLKAERNDITLIPIPFRDLATPLTKSVKLRKLLINMVYVGVLAELLGIPDAITDSVIDHQFAGKDSVLDVNKAALAAGRAHAKEQLKDLKFPFQAQAVPGGSDEKILIDGNSAAAAGLLFGGCSVVAWYPITPSSSLVETFIELADQYRPRDGGQKPHAIVQAEDELAAISMVIGAGWAGARAMTATSGPGLSLMAEAAGLAYYAEIPAVIWDVQRVGPSTGLPTRTMQGDLQSAATLSHGDTQHIVLLPATPEECFVYAQTAFDLAERLQTLAIVLTDLDLGMNFHVSQSFTYPTRPFDRGKVLNVEQLQQMASEFQRYKDVDGDGIPYRTLPGTEHPTAAFFTRGTGHDESGLYSENHTVFAKNLDRLRRKFETARTLVPQPVVDEGHSKQLGLIAFGSTDLAMAEIRELLGQKGVNSDYLCLKALPLSSAVRAFIQTHEKICVVEQNQSGQLAQILTHEYPDLAPKIRSIRIYDGLPLCPDEVHELILKEGGLK